MSVPGSTAISARWASPSTTRYLVGFETGPLQFPTHENTKYTKQSNRPASGPAQSQAPRGRAPARVDISHRGLRGHRQKPRPPVTLTLVSYRAAHSLSRSSPLRLRPPSRLSSISSISGLRSRPLHLRSGASVDVSSSSLCLGLSHSHGNAGSRHLGACAPARRVLHSSVLPLSTPPSSTPPDLSDASDVNRGSGSARLR
jgi:hypothetical protein